MTNLEYWTERINNQGYETIEHFLTDLLKVYRTAHRNINNEIKNTLLDCMDSDGNLKITSLYERNRLKNLMDLVDYELQQLGFRMIEGLELNLVEIFKEAYMNIAVQVLNVPEKKVATLFNESTARTIVMENYKGASFSTRIWGTNLSPVRQQIQDSVIQTCIQGKDVRKASEELSRIMGSSIADAKRLCITETARIHSEATRNTALDNGYRSFYVLSESDCCEACSDLSGIHYSLNRRDILPAHPHCKCCMCIDVHYDGPIEE